MNDWWNDPPEQFETPECCEEIMDLTNDGVCVCLKCGKRIEPPVDVDPPEQTNEEEVYNE